MPEMRKGFWVTLGTAVVSFLLMAPADIVEFFSWLPKSILDQIPSSSRVWTFFGLCEITVGLGDRFYLPVALVLNIFLLFRKQPPVWLKVFVWLLFLVAVLGAVRVETELLRRVP
jgi:hypothetical protein